VIHTVGPVWSGGRRGEPELLASCYRESLKLAAANELKSIAFPAISCGAYGYPLADAVRIAVRECAAFAAENPLPETIIFACFDAVTLAAYEAELARL
jgi:O-acetyl-ADP-ribose deacetylase (regulator of RNase III)